MSGTARSWVSSTKPRSSRGSQRRRSPSGSPKPVWIWTGRPRSTPAHSRNRSSTGSAIRMIPLDPIWRSHLPAAPVTSAAVGGRGSKSSPNRYATMLFTPHAKVVRSHSAARNRSAKPAADPFPATMACSATPSRRTTSSTAAPAASPIAVRPSIPSRRIAGVDQQVGDPAGRQQPAGHLGRPELMPAAGVGLGRPGRGQPEHGAAPAADRDTELGVEPRHPRRDGAVRLRDQLLELAVGKLGRQRRVDMVVHQGDRADRRAQIPLVMHPAVSRLPAAPPVPTVLPAPAGTGAGAGAAPAADQVQQHGDDERDHGDAGDPPEPGTVGDHRPERC